MNDHSASSSSTTSFTDRQRTYSTRSNASPVPRHTPSPGLRRFESTARPSASPVERSTSYRSSALRSNGAPKELQPRYFGRRGSEESALAGKPSVSRLGGLGIDFPKADKEDDLFSDGSSQAAESRASRTRDLLRRIEQEDQESERKTRELREVHAIKRAESSMSISRFSEQHSQDNYGHPATPLHRRNFNGPTRGSAFTAGLPLRPSTSMAFTSDAPRTAPPLGQGLRSHRSVWNLQTHSSSSSLAGQREGSPSPSLVRRRRLSGDPSGLGEGGRRTAMDLRSATSFGFPSSTSVQSSLASFATSDSQHPEHVRNMLAAFEALERHYSRLSGYSSSAAVVEAAHSLISAVEQANFSLTQANNFVREQVVAAQVDERKEVGDVEAWQAMLAVIKDAVRMNDEEIRASTILMIATLKGTRELMSTQQQSSGRGSGEIRRSETADWTSYRHGRETPEPSASFSHVYPYSSLIELTGFARCFARSRPHASGLLRATLDLHGLRYGLLSLRPTPRQRAHPRSPGLDSVLAHPQPHRRRRPIGSVSLVCAFSREGRDDLTPIRRARSRFRQVCTSSSVRGCAAS